MDEKEGAGSPIKPGMTKKKEPRWTISKEPSARRKQPRWTIAFLRSLERTGSVEEAARDAGIDKSTAYHRRRDHPEFADEWEGALGRRSGAVEAEVTERVGFWERLRGKVTPATLRKERASLDEPGTNVPTPGPSRDREGRKEELLASTALGGKVVRVGPGRWNAAAEERFFAELAASANVRRAAEAAGVSANAVYQRRLKRPDFRAKWDAVLETGRSAIEMHLIETAKKSFQPDDLDVGDVQPKVSVTEAIRIVQLHGSKAQKHELEEAGPGEEEIEAVRQRVFDKLQRLRKREMPRMLAEGWSYDEERNHMVPPGWVRATPAKTCVAETPERGDDKGDSSATGGG